MSSTVNAGDAVAAGVSLDDSELRLIGNSPGMRKVRELIDASKEEAPQAAS